MASNKIVLKGDYVLEEAIAHEAITPGCLIQLNSDAEIALMATDEGVIEVAVAIENALAGKTIDDACSSGDRIRYAILQRGAVAYMFLKAGENASIGEWLVPTTGGIWKCNSADANSDKRAVALEAVNNTGGTSLRIKVRIA